MFSQVTLVKDLAVYQLRHGKVGLLTRRGSL